MALAVPVWLAVQEELECAEGDHDGSPNPFDLFDDVALFKFFHLTRPCITFVADAVRARLKAVAGSKTLPPVDVMVMVCLNYYAHGAFTPMVLQKCGMNQPTNVTQVVNTVSGVLAGMADVFISFPLTVDARKRTAAKMEEFCGIPKVLGVLAPGHFKIRASPYEQSSFKAFINALGYTSVVSQFICDCDGNILSVEKCCVGSTCEQEMWEASFKGREVEEDLHGKFWFVGGTGYNPSKHVLTPVLNPSNDNEVRFNDVHLKIQKIMLSTLSCMKRRFKCLLQLGFAEESSLNKKSNMIKACSVLHNIAKKFSVPSLPEDGTTEHPYPRKSNPAQPEIDPAALKARQELINTYCSADPDND